MIYNFTSDILEPLKISKTNKKFIMCNLDHFNQMSRKFRANDIIFFFSRHGITEAILKDQGTNY